MGFPRSKLRRPAVPAFALDRPRLLGPIRASAWRVVLLQAPAGYGKSILAAQVAAAEPRTTAWLHLDSDDAEPRRFCRAIAAAIAEVVPALARTELAALTERESFEPARWAEDLLLFFDEVAPDRCRLILDNAESIADAQGPLQCLRRLIRPGSERLSLLLASRRALAVTFQRLVAQRRALVLRETELAFELDEYRRAARAHGLQRTDSRLEQDWARGRGWCVLLGLEGTWTAGEDPGRAYLEEEVLGALPSDLRDFLRRTSILDVVSRDAVEALGLEEEVESRLAELARHGVPHLLVDDGRAARVHPLIRERFIAELRMVADEARTLAERASRWLRQQGRHDAAVQRLAAMGLGEHVLRLIDEDWPEIERLNLQPRVRSWVDRVDRSLRRHPFYVSALARHLRYLGENRQLADLIERARTEGAVPEESRIAPRLWALETWALTNLAEAPSYDSLASAWGGLRDRADAADQVLGEFSLANAAVYELRFESAMSHVRAVLDLLPPDAARTRAGARNAVAVILHELGRSREAIQVHDENIEECLRHGETSHLALNLVGKSYALKELGRYAEALEAVEHCLELSRRSGSPRLTLVSHATRTRGEAWWHLGRRREGLVELERAYRSFQDHNRFEALGTGVLIDHWKRLAGEPSERVTEADFAEHPVCEPHVRFLVHRGRMDGLGGRTESALARLTAARELAREMPAWEATAWLTEAWVVAGAGRVRDAHHALRQGLQRLLAIGTASYPMADATLTAWTITEAVAAAILPEQAGALVRGGIAAELTEAFRGALETRERTGAETTRLMDAAIRWRVRGLDDVARLHPRVPARARKAYQEMVERSPLPPLRVRMFGPFEVSVSGRDVRFSRKASRAVLEILLIEAPRPVHQERLMAALWPDADRRRAARGLQTAINQLRSTLDPFHRANAPSYVSFEEDHYRLHLPEGSEVDLHRFSEGLPRLARVRDASGPEGRTRLRELLALYRGDLLADAPYSEHAVEPREQQRAAFLEGVGALARAIGDDDPADAVHLLERGLEADAFWSEGVALLLSCLVRDGRVLAAVRWYRAYEARLERDLGVAPDPELRRLVDPILRSG